MKITTTRENVHKNGSKTVTVIEEDMNGADMNQFQRHLETIGFYDSQPWYRRLMRFVRGKTDI